MNKNNKIKVLTIYRNKHIRAYERLINKQIRQLTGLRPYINEDKAFKDIINRSNTYLEGITKTYEKLVKQENSIRNKAAGK